MYPYINYTHGIVSLLPDEVMKMMTQGSCPVCSSEEVYCLLNTLHCKRCGNIWTEEKNIRIRYDISNAETPVSKQKRTPAITDTLEQRMEKQLEGYLKKSRGEFSRDTITSNIGDIHMAMFRNYLKKCVKNRTLVEKKDQYGILWYSRPD
jgi:hypothetical protein